FSRIELPGHGVAYVNRDLIRCEFVELDVAAAGFSTGRDGERLGRRRAERGQQQCRRETKSQAHASQSSTGSYVQHNRSSCIQTTGCVGAATSEGFIPNNRAA